LILTRLAFVLAVMAGIVLMHSLVVSPHASAGQGQHEGHAAIVEAGVTEIAEVTGAIAPAANCAAGSECADSWVLHVCAVILAAAITGMAAGAIRRVIPVLRIGVPRGVSPSRVKRSVSRRWVLPSLTVLSILRQ